MFSTEFAFATGSSVAAAAAASGAGGGVKAARFKQPVDAYAWEAAYERSWDAIEEDEATGALVTRGLQRRRRAEGGGGGDAAAAPPADADAAAPAAVQRGMLRHVFLVLDMSKGMEGADFKPSRREAAHALAKEFVREYFDQNPISQLGVIVTRNAVAEKVSEMSGNPRRHTDAIDAACRQAPAGDMSLQTALDIAVKCLSQLPAYGTREVVLVHGAHATCDPGDIDATLAELVRERVRVSVVSLPGEVFLPARLARETGGTARVPESYDDFRRALLHACRPPARRAADGPADSPLVQMGFPTLVHETPGLCGCHGILRPRGYLCPRCGTRSCEVPTRCVVCALTLVSAPTLARSYHHLFGVPAFVEVPDAGTPGEWRGRGGSSGGAGGGVGAAQLVGEPQRGGAAGAGDDAALRCRGGKRRRGDDDDAGGAGEGGAAVGADVNVGHDDDESSSSSSAQGRLASGGGDVSSSGSLAPAAAARSRGRAAEGPPPGEHEADEPAQRHVELVRDASACCAGCAHGLRADQARYVCPACWGAFCADCDELIHETLHNCPGCCAG